MPLPRTTYPYQISLARNAVGLSASLAATGVFAWLARTNTEPLHLFESVNFSKGGADLLYGLIALIAAASVLYFVIRLKRSLKGPVELRLDAQDLRTPRASLRSEMLSMPYASITRVMIHSVSNQQLLVIDSPVGRSRLSSMGFESEDAFEAFYKDLVVRVGRP